MSTKFEIDQIESLGIDDLGKLGDELYHEVSMLDVNELFKPFTL